MGRDPVENELEVEEETNSCMTKIKAWIDEKIFWLAYRSFNRHLKRTPWDAYILELSLKQWREQHPIGKDLEESCERFVESMSAYTYKP